MVATSTMLLLAVINLCSVVAVSPTSCSNKKAYVPTHQRGNFTLMTLPYAQDYLESEISQEIVNLHYGTHHAGYVSKLNAFTAANPQYAAYDLVDLLSYVGSDPSVQKFAGGDYNHNLYWWTMTSAQCFKNVTGSLGRAIDSQWGNFSNFQTAFNTAAGTVFGSGWTWLCAGHNGNLTITNSANQLNPLVGRSADSCVPILGVDLWEHAYYLEYKANRAAYVSTWWNIVDWAVVQHFYEDYAVFGVPVPF
jgi:Fe-Mn family superoxide dismutase